MLARIKIHLQLTWRAPPAVHETPADPEPQGDEIVLRAAMRLIENQLDDMPSLGLLAQKSALTKSASPRFFASTWE